MIGRFHSWNKMAMQNCAFSEWYFKLDSRWGWRRHDNLNCFAIQVHIFVRVSLEWMKREGKKVCFLQNGWDRQTLCYKVWRQLAEPTNFQCCRFKILHLIESGKQLHSRKMTDGGAMKVEQLDAFNRPQVEHTLLRQHCWRSFNLSFREITFHIKLTARAARKLKCSSDACILSFLTFKLIELVVTACNSHSIACVH